MANAFNQAREDNLALGTMTTGKVAPPTPARMPAPDSVGYQAVAPTGKLYSIEVASRVVTVQGSPEEIEGLHQFFDDYGLRYTIRPINLMNIEVLKAGITFAVPRPEPTVIATKPLKRKRVTKRSKDEVVSR